MGDLVPVNVTTSCRCGVPVVVALGTRSPRCAACLDRRRLRREWVRRRRAGAATVMTLIGSLFVLPVWLANGGNAGPAAFCATVALLVIVDALVDAFIGTE